MALSGNDIEHVQAVLKYYHESDRVNPTEHSIASAIRTQFIAKNFVLTPQQAAFCYALMEYHEKQGLIPVDTSHPANIRQVSAKTAVKAMR